MGDKLDAEVYYDPVEAAYHALKDAEKVLGEDALHPDIAQCYENMGHAYFVCRIYSKALKYHSYSLDSRLDYYGKKACYSPQVGNSYLNIGRTHIARLRYNRGVDAFTNALEVFRSIYGEHCQHEKIGTAYNEIGIALRLQCKFQESMNYHSQALAMFKDIHGHNSAHDHVAVSYKYIGDLMRDQGQYTTAAQHYRKSLHLYAHSFGEKWVSQPGAFAIRHHVEAFVGFGQLYNLQGKYAHAIDRFRQACLSYRSFFGDEEMEGVTYATFYDSEGDAHIRNGDFVSAKEEYVSALDLKMVYYDEEDKHALIADSYCKLANLHVKMFEFDEAEHLYAQALNVYEKAYKDEPNVNHPDIARCYAYIGLFYQQTAKYESAVKTLKDALLRFKEFYGSTVNHPDISWTLGLISRVLCEMGEFNAAHKYICASLTMNKNIHVGNFSHPVIATNYSDMADIYAGQRKYHEAMEYYTKSLTLFECVVGDEGTLQEIVDLHNNIGKLYLKQDNLGEAVREFIRGSSHAKLLYSPGNNGGQGECHPTIALGNKYIGDVHAEYGNYSQALDKYFLANQQYDDCYSMQDLSGSHPDKAHVQSAIGNVLLKQGEINRALERFKAAEYIMLCAYGTIDHPSRGDLSKSIGDAYVLLADYDKACDHYRAAIGTRMNCFGDNTPHPSIAEGYFCAGCCFAHLGQLDACLDYHQKALAIKQITYEGESHEDLAASYDGVGTAYLLLNDYENALPNLTKGLNMRQVLCAQDEVESEDVAQSYTKLANYYLKVGDHQTSLDYHQKALDINKAALNTDFITSGYDDMGHVYCQLEDWNAALTAHSNSFNLKEHLYHQELQESQLSYDESPERTCEVQQRHLPGLAITQCFIGNAYYQLGSSMRYNVDKEDERYNSLRSAYNAYLESLRLWQKVQGERGHPEVAKVYNNIGLVLQEQIIQKTPNSSLEDNYAGAIDHHQQALSMRRELYGEDANHPLIAESLKNLGYSHSQRLENDCAHRYLFASLDMYKAIHGEDTPREEIADVMQLIGNVYYDREEFPASIRLFKSAAKIFEEIYGIETKGCHKLASIYQNLSHAYYRRNDVTRSQKYQEMVSCVLGASDKPASKPTNCLLM